MLEQVSALGDDVSLSMLIGSSEAMEAKVLEFIDQAVAQGLLQSDFQLNDEVIRFLGKRVLEIAYGSIEQDRKQELHERIGNYQETLYQQQLLPSAATLAYHFKRSTDQEKAGTYERILSTSNDRKFNAREAILYTTEEPAEAVGADVPLDAEAPGPCPPYDTRVHDCRPKYKALPTQQQARYRRHEKVEDQDRWYLRKK